MALVTVAHMDLFLDLTLGAGLALAAGLRPFFPALLAGALGGADLAIDFDHTDFGFLESAAFLIAVGALFLLITAAERRIDQARLEAGPIGAALRGVALGIGALLFAGALSQHGDAGWPGIPLGLACAALAQSAASGVVRGARARLKEASARAALPLYLDALALALAGLSLAVPPISLVAAAFLVRLRLAGRRRADERYAGLRVLR